MVVLDWAAAEAAAVMVAGARRWIFIDLSRVLLPARYNMTSVHSKGSYM